jgi:SAM-dependent methyltransferase
MVWDKDDFTSNGREVDKCRERLKRYCTGIGLDIGCGSMIEEKGFPTENKIVPHAIGFDKGYTNVRGSAEKIPWFTNESLDFVFSSHLLEHIEDYKGCLQEWWRVLKVGGMLVLYLPHPDFYPCIGTGLGNPDHKNDFKPLELLNDIRTLNLSFDIVHIQEHNEEKEYSFDFVLRRNQ